MIVEYIRYRIPAELAAAFERDYANAARSLDASPWCLGYELAGCTEEPACYVLRIEWTSAEDHLQRFRGSAEFASFLAAIKPYIGNIDEMRHYRATAVANHKETT
jgi:quinol monooxygenase YgiN